MKDMSGDKDYDRKIKILSEAIEKKVLIIETEEYEKLFRDMVKKRIQDLGL